MQALEEELQASLFIRQKNRIVLNEVGQVAVEYARQVLAAAEELGRRVQLAQRTGRSVALGSCAPFPFRISGRCFRSCTTTWQLLRS